VRHKFGENAGLVRQERSLSIRSTIGQGAPRQVGAPAGLGPKSAWQERVRRHFKGTLKPPFNDAARKDAGFDPDFYRPLSA
jgi:uncharacterized ferritin-like protein (DUF455 family)